MTGVLDQENSQKCLGAIVIYKKYISIFTSLFVLLVSVFFSPAYAGEIYVINNIFILCGVVLLMQLLGGLITAFKYSKPIPRVVYGYSIYILSLLSSWFSGVAIVYLINKTIPITTVTSMIIILSVGIIPPTILLRRMS
ncbi:hypothetical protein [Gynuella sunshinyii]|uniref:hypothetical protein n=1 Tax=Gynuella sunshinyii TaxID=1445505 RepID=UPI0005CC42CC|nr:hypothetical protein [Gynuella sunshinyii]